MKVKQLINELEKANPETDVQTKLFGCCDTELYNFEICYDDEWKDDDQNDPFGPEPFEINISVGSCAKLGNMGHCNNEKTINTILDKLNINRGQVALLLLDKNEDVRKMITKYLQSKGELKHNDFRDLLG